MLSLVGKNRMELAICFLCRSSFRCCQHKSCVYLPGSRTLTNIMIKYYELKCISFKIWCLFTLMPRSALNNVGDISREHCTHKCFEINNENICLNVENLKTCMFSKLAVIGA